MMSGLPAPTGPDTRSNIYTSSDEEIAMTDGNPQQEAYFASTRGTGRPGKISQTPEQRYLGRSGTCCW